MRTLKGTVSLGYVGADVEFEDDGTLMGARREMNIDRAIEIVKNGGRWL